MNAMLQILDVITWYWRSLFLLGRVGVLTRRNVVIVLMSIELIRTPSSESGCILALLARYAGSLVVPTPCMAIFAIFVITDAAQKPQWLGILIAFFRNKETVNMDEVNC